MKRKSEPTVYTKQSRERIAAIIAEMCDGSQQRFAEKTGINKASVSQWMHGNNVPGSIAASKIARAFGISPAWVMGFDVPRVVDAPRAMGELSPIEARIIEAYRMADGITQGHVCLILGVDPGEKGAAESSVSENGAEHTA